MPKQSNNALRLFLGTFLLLLIVFPAWSQNTSATPQTSGDNSKINQQDRQKTEPTADNQKDNATDLNLTRDIRRSLIADKSLSSYAHNVKIIAQHGKVTLKGPVRSDDEKNVVLAKAATVAGKDNINDELTIAPKHK